MFFNSSNEEFNKPLNKEINGFIMKLLGGVNDYHGKQSDYCVSTLQG